MDGVTDSPIGNVYFIHPDFEGDIHLPRSTKSFTWSGEVENIGTLSWDTTDKFFIAYQIVAKESAHEIHPFSFVNGRCKFTKPIIAPSDRQRFEISANTSDLPFGEYVMIIDLIKELEYYLGWHGGQKLIVPLYVSDASPVGDAWYPYRIQKASPPARALAVAPWAGGSGLPFNYYEKAEVFIDPQGFPVVGNATPPSPDRFPLPEKMPGNLNLTLRWFPNYISHYFHFMEMVIGLYSICREYFGTYDVDRVFIGNQPFYTDSNIDVQISIIHALFPGCDIVQGDPNQEFGEVPNLLSFDGGLSHSPMNKLLEKYVYISSLWMPSIRNKVISYTMQDHEICQRHSIKQRKVVYARRSERRTLSPAAEKDLLGIIEASGCHISILDFGNMPFSSQVGATADCDVMIGVHGNNLTNLLWMRPGTVSIEIFPAGFHAFDYQIFSEIVGVTYFGIEGKQDGFIFRDQCRLPAHSSLQGVYSTLENHGENVTDLPWDFIRSLFAKAHS